MTINHEKKLIFIHIPKNAGTSIIKAINCEKNFYIDRSIDEYKEYYKDYWNSYTKFTVVRDPFDRFISAYKFARMDESGWFSATGQEGLKKHPHYEICKSMDINEYIQFLYAEPENINRWVAPQSWIIANEDGKIEIDYFVRYENLSEDLKQIGIENIEKLNSSSIEKKDCLNLTKKSKIILSIMYNLDFCNFNYKLNNTLFTYG